MRDPADIRTKKGTSVVVIGTRAAFAAYFIFSALALYLNWFPGSDLSWSWLIYLIALYYIAERFYAVFLERGIILDFAFPLLFAVYMLNLVSLIFEAQEKLPLLNRAEHFSSFILIAYIVWVFFLQYLPQRVWRQHPYYTAILVLAVTSLMGVVNEVVELLLDGVFKTKLIGKSNIDTSLDLLMNTLGSGLFLGVRLIVGLSEESKKKKA